MPRGNCLRLDNTITLLQLELYINKKAYTKEFDEKVKKSKTALEAAEKAGDEKAISAATKP